MKSKIIIEQDLDFSEDCYNIIKNIDCHFKNGKLEYLKFSYSINQPDLAGKTEKSCSLQIGLEGLSEVKNLLEKITQFSEGTLKKQQEKAEMFSGRRIIPGEIE